MQVDGLWIDFELSHSGQMIELPEVRLRGANVVLLGAQAGHQAELTVRYRGLLDQQPPGAGTFERHRQRLVGAHRIDLLSGEIEVLCPRGAYLAPRGRSRPWATYPR